MLQSFLNAQGGGPLSRRRFMSITAAAIAVAGNPADAAPVTHWRGRALGAAASMQLTGLAPDKAQGIFRMVELEIARLERIFSLHQPHSQIVRLNTTGLLRRPAPEMLEVLSLSDTLHHASEGAFDPTIQPVWQAVATAGIDGTTPDILSKCGWHRLRFDASAIRLERSGALTLNGIAQGYVTDRISSLLRAKGLSDVLIDMGEIAAIGPKPWQVGIALPDQSLVNRITLSERALATSAPMGTVLSASDGLGHILDPHDPTGRPRHQLISVSAGSAAVADGLSTALCLLRRDQLVNCAAAFPDATIETLI